AALLQRHLELERATVAIAGECDASAVGAEPYELLVGTRPRREALRADVERLEQVRLARPVRARDEHEPRFERELEALVGTEVAERDVPDDQALVSLPRQPD